MSTRKCKCCGDRRWVRMIVNPDTFAWRYRGCPICSGGSADRLTIVAFSQIHADRMGDIASALTDAFERFGASIQDLGASLNEFHRAANKASRK